MTTAQLWVPGRPQVKQRPRMTRKGRTYTPKATHDAEAYIAMHAAEAGLPIFDGPVEVLVDYYPEGQMLEIRSRDWSSPLTGDVDNYAKLTLDALQVAGVVPNDKQVVSLWVAKHPKGVVQGVA